MEKRAIFTEKAPLALGPYSQAVISEDMVYTSGQLGIVPETGELEPDAKAQTRQALCNIKALLKAAGSDMEHVIKTTVLLKNMEDFERVNQAYARFFKEPFPARSAFQVAALPAGALVEIEAIAHRNR